MLFLLIYAVLIKNAIYNTIRIELSHFLWIKPHLFHDKAFCTFFHYLHKPKKIDLKHYFSRLKLIKTALYTPITSEGHEYRPRSCDHSYDWNRFTCWRRHVNNSFKNLTRLKAARRSTRRPTLAAWRRVYLLIALSRFLSAFSRPRHYPHAFLIIIKSPFGILAVSSSSRASPYRDKDGSRSPYRMLSSITVSGVPC